MKYKTLTIILTILLVLLPSCNKPVEMGTATETIDVMADPVQESENGSPITLVIRSGQMVISPVASYSLAGILKSKKSYSSGWQGQVAPIDLAMVWGKLTLPEYDQYMSYRQARRWYYYRYKAGFPDNRNYIISHSANNHIIPANDNILAAVKSINTNQKVLLSGYLVKLNGTYKGRSYYWNSSLTRNDSGDASCEVFYVNEVQLKGKIYK